MNWLRLLPIKMITDHTWTSESPTQYCLIFYRFTEHTQTHSSIIIYCVLNLVLLPLYYFLCSFSGHLLTSSCVLPVPKKFGFCWVFSPSMDILHTS